ncbi:MAG: FGGY family carbohydrate kinase, partial [Solirubrobacteraceae bacterium]
MVDVGTTSVRASIVLPDATVTLARREPLVVATPAPGLVEIDAERMAESVVRLASVVLGAGGPVLGLAIAAQRATTVVWERATGRPVAPAIGWQDLRTVTTCLDLQSQGVRLAPNMSATKVAAILDDIDPERRRADQLCAGTVESWIAWTLTGGSAAPGALHVTDATNAAVTGMLRTGGDAEGRYAEWDPVVLDALRIPVSMLGRIVDTCGALSEAAALPGSPPLCALVGDQQASLVGQGCTQSGRAKATFGTGGMLDVCTGNLPPPHPGRSQAGTFPIVAWRHDGALTWGAEAVMLTAGACVDWLKEKMGLIENAAQSADIASSCASTDGVTFVPALFGLGTPVWDFGARGALLGLTQATGRHQIVRAVLEGIAQRGADLLAAAEADSGCSVETLRVDGGMSANDVFVHALAE